MKENLAKKLVAELMNWTVEFATSEFAWLELMVSYKFDGYQQYGPGHRFYVHLLRWLSQFAPAQRERAWLLLRHHVVYVSQDELNHLVSLTGSSIEHKMRAAVARRLQMPVYRVLDDPKARRQFDEMRYRTLYVGASDGARIDVFRRYNEGAISNEQVVPMIEISAAKQAKLKEKLQQRLNAVGSTAPATFEWVCLIDDFTASGTTSIRKSEAGWDGKVHRFMEEAVLTDNSLTAADAHIQVHHYLASHTASQAVTKLLGEYGLQHPNLQYIPTFSHVFPEDFVITAESQPEIAALLESRYDPSIETSHTGPGIAMGYKSGGLPLVLDHNTPNNSLATLWARSVPDRDNYIEANHMSPLFPRRSRHSDVRS